MSLRLTTAAFACSLVVAAFAQSASADEAYVPAERVAPAAQGAPAHYAQPPAARRLPPDQGLLAPALDRDQLRAILKVRRETNLATFRAYAAAGVYPSNTYNNGSLNVWRDRDGHLCAAATIINQSGATQLVNRVADQNNFIKLADVKQGPVEDWILTSGFTQEELVAIQRPFYSVAKPSPKPSAKPQPALFDDDIDPPLRQAETARLKTVYKQVERQLVRDEAKSLDAAADRLFKHPTQAWALLTAANS